MSTTPSAAGATAASTPSTTRRIRNMLSRGLLWSTVALLVIMTALVLYQVFTRYVLSSPVAFTEELVRYALIWVSFIAGTYAFLERQHMALTIVRDRFPARSKRVLVIGIDVLILVLAMLVLGIGGAFLAWGSRGDISALIGISRGLVYAVVPIAGAAITLAQVLNIVDTLRGTTPDTAPSTSMESE